MLHTNERVITGLMRVRFCASANIQRANVVCCSDWSEKHLEEHNFREEGLQRNGAVVLRHGINVAKSVRFPNLTSMQKT